jgi:cytochrome c oxidase cbb3-type subunit 3
MVYGAVVWFVAYWVLYYHTGLLKTDHERVSGQLVAIQQAKAEELERTLATLDDSTLVHEWATSPEVISAGEATYLQNCSACHAADLSATMLVGGNTIPLPGLPLNDGEWKFGGRPMQIFKIINEGSPPESDGYNGAKMQVWGQNLSPKQVAEVTAFLISKLPGDFADIPAK